MTKYFTNSKMQSMNKQDLIATKHKKSSAFVSLLKNGTRFTTDPDLAKSVSVLSGKKPIEHISPKLRKAYLKAYPELGKKVKGT